MRFWPQSLAGRLLLSLMAAAGGVLALAHFAAERDLAAAAAAIPAPVAPPRIQRQVVPVPAVTGRILLTSSPTIVPDGRAPVVQLLDDGSEVLRRAPPLPEGPEASTLLAGEAVIVLPAPTLQRMGPEARGALIDLVGRLVRERPVPAARFATLDFPMPLAELQRLLEWVP